MFHETFCPGTTDERGCEQRGVCISSSKMDLTGFLPCPAICQPTCDPGEIFCQGLMSARNCPTLGTCIRSTLVGKNGSPCPPQCPVSCDRNAIICHGSVDENGCQAADFCVEKCKIFKPSELTTTLHYYLQALSCFYISNVKIITITNISAIYLHLPDTGEAVDWFLDKFDALIFNSGIFGNPCDQNNTPRYGTTTVQSSTANPVLKSESTMSEFPQARILDAPFPDTG